jgi:predicted phage tail protein
MRRFLISTGAAALAALAVVGCDQVRSPARPTESVTPSSVASSIPLQSATAVSWPCFALTPFSSTECARSFSPIRGASLAAAAVAPSQPLNLMSVVSGNAVMLQWIGPTSGDPAGSYGVEAGSSSGLVDLANFDTGSNAQSLTVTGVPSGVYFVRVRAKNLSGISGPSNEIIVIVAGTGPCGTAPNPPTAFAASAIGTLVSLTWTAPSGGCSPTSYVIEAGSASTLANLTILNTGSTATSFSASGVAGGTYYVRVRAANANGQSAPTNETAFTVACNVPGVPTGVNMVTSSSTVALGWTAISGATSYVVEIGTSSGGTNIANTTTTATSFAVSASPGTYYARVRARNACGTSAASTQVSGTIASTSPTCNGGAVPAIVDCLNNLGFRAPTAQCNDGAWSCSQNRSGTCSSHGGVRCYVCPGPLC